MGISETESTTILVGREPTPNANPASYLMLQPNPGGIRGFNPQFDEVVRDPLSKLLTLEQGGLVGMSVEIQITQDLTKDILDYFGQDLFRTLPKHSGGTGVALFRAAPAVAGAPSSFTVGAGGAFTEGSIVVAQGYAEAANNGMHIVGAGSVAATINVTSTLVAEGTPPLNATLEFVGFAGGAGEFSINAAGNLASTTVDFTTRGILPGMDIVIGGELDAQRFGTEGYNGIASVRAVTANELVLDNRSWTVGAPDTGVGKTIHVYVASRWYRNVPRDHGDYLTTSHTLELEDPGAGAGDVPSYTYATGCRLKTFEIDAGSKTKMVATMTFIGNRMANPVLAASRKPGAATPMLPMAVALFNTATDIRIDRITTASNDGVLAAEISDSKLTYENNVTGYDAHGHFGPPIIVWGKFTPMLTGNAYYLTDELPKAIRSNAVCTATMGARNNNGGWVAKFATGSLRGGDKSYDAAAATKVAYTFQPFRNSVDNTIQTLSVFGYMPPQRELF